MKERQQEGVILKDTRLQAWRAIREHQMSADHPYRDVARRWYPIVDDMEATFFNGIVYPDGGKVPAPLLAFDEYNKKSLAHVDLFEDEYGLIGKITVNTAYFVDWEEGGSTTKKYVLGDYSLGETITHEFAHVWQQFGPRAKDPFNQKKHHRVTHNAEWHEFVRGLGLNTEGPAGVHTKPATLGSPVDLFLRRHGITPPEGVEEAGYDGKSNWSKLVTYKDKEKPKGRSSLTKYTCPNCGLNARIGVKEDPMLVHAPCGSLLIKAESGTIYKSK
jgi:hypothetical protein